MYCIYYIKNKITNQYYIGQTKDFNDRIERHIKLSKKPKPTTRISYSIKKYGIDNFEYDIIKNDIQTKEEASELEMYYINEYNSFLDGYNTTRGGEYNLSGIKRTDEQKIKISEATKKAMDNPELKQRLSDFWNEYYKTHSAWNKGLKGCYSEETRKKISEAKKGKPIVFSKSKEELFEKRSTASKRNNADRHWYTNGEKDVRINSSEISTYISMGYRIGRSFANAKNKKHYRKCQNII